MQKRSTVEMLARLSPEEQARVWDMLPTQVAANAAWDWSNGGLARRSQRYPSGAWWEYWLLLSGRGFGKTRILSSVCREWAVTLELPAVGMVGATADDTRRILVEGESGVMATAPRWDRPIYKKNDRVLEWPNGAKTYLFSAEDPDRFRGANLYGLLADELAAWKKPRDTWDQAMLTLRLGKNPRAVIATTPRPIPLIKDLASNPRTYLTTGSTYDNAANLSSRFLERVVGAYGDTRLGQQELMGGILLDTPGALWSDRDIRHDADALDGRTPRRIVVSVDPSGSETGDEVGIVVVGEIHSKSYIVLDDRSTATTPGGWARRVAQTFDLWGADVVVAETNFGGAMVTETLRHDAPNLPIKVIHASRGKVVRAQPPALAYERNEVVHLRQFPDLERQMLQMSETDGYMGKGSPDRVDALVHALNYLMGTRGAPTAGVVAPGRSDGHGGLEPRKDLTRST